MKLVSKILFYALLLIITFSSCKKNKLITDTSAKVEFSNDTVIFDTVFTQLGTITKHFKIYNPHNQAINISSIYIQGSNDSIFRMNVDGASGNYHEDIEIQAKDSIYVFIEATLEANNVTNPMIITDSIMVVTNGNTQQIDLVAWGQDAYYWFSPTGNFDFALVPDQENIWFQLPNDKPNIVYGYARVDSSQTLELLAGTRLHFHKNSGLYVGSGATIKVNGTLDQSVIFESDRLDSEYRDVPGQWGHPLLEGGIILGALSFDNEFNYAEIKHGTFGLRVDSFITQGVPTVVLNNCIIDNMSYAGLNALTSNVQANNSVFTNCGLYTAALLYGGEYEFNHCTFGNYWSFSSRNNGQLLLNNFYESSTGSIITRDLTRADFNNCIIYGSNENEIEFSQSDNTTYDFNYLFTDCLIKSDDPTNSNFSNCILNPASVQVEGMTHDPVFNDYNNNDFKLFSLSAALDHGQVIIGLELDFEGNTRNNPVDLGAYEFIE